jgi:5-methylcytosine-specific restriction endonuclease McrA
MPIAPPVACNICKQPNCKGHASVAEQPAERVICHSKFLNRARWRHPSTGLRAVKLRKNPICEDPFNERCHKPATQVHHKIDHHDDERLFFDFNNLQALCISCHSRITSSEHSKTGKHIHRCLPALVDGKIANQG